MTRYSLVFGAFYLTMGFAIEDGHVKKKMLENPIGRHKSTPKNTREGHYTCSTFGTDACKLVCMVVCDLYDCKSNGHCSGNQCKCNERFEISSTLHTPEEYRSLPTLLIWYRKFGDSSYSKKIYDAIRENQEIMTLMEPIIRNPTQTAIDLKSHLLQLRPDWQFLYKLKPVRRSYIEDFIEENANKFDYDHFDQYIDMVVDYITDKFYYSYVKPNTRDTQQQIEVRCLYKLMALCKNEWLLNYIRGFKKRYGYDDQNILTHFDPKNQKKMSPDSAISVLMISVVDHIMAYEKRYDKGIIEGSRKHTMYYLLSKRQIDDLNDFDFEDFEEGMQQQARV